MNSFRLAKKEELHEVATLFTESFLEYPLFPLILKQDKDYKKYLYRLNYTNTKSYLQQNACFVGTLDGKIVSAVLLKKSGAKGPGFVQYLFNGGLALAGQIGIKRIYHILKTLDKMKEACNRYWKESWYIDSFAVAKGHQGKNLGSTLFNAFLFPLSVSMGAAGLHSLPTPNLIKSFTARTVLRFLTNLA
ncbi:GNAT family N-acetyltransferase [Paenibacillus sp. DMB5]|uniref:GNAT family N-acetyltransferase n=1 Tax=Paenibacillus sp. DMB5 TaxID=1780103 RepID=UPI00076C39A4|nr:GNAT family N-acetyltransferase [Paenibacillus sp. DMB5]KUP23263.1 hypothetical protein AWJ19_30545 [Paenibacillus sp. DMB5]